MTYYEAARQVLKSARRPMTTREITNLAIQRKLLVTRGKTPLASMSAVLYLRVRDDPELVKIAAQGSRRAKRGSVRWTLRQG
jgi:hypothetical protein